MQRNKNIIVGAALVGLLLLMSRKSGATVGNLSIINIVDDLPKHPTKFYDNRSISDIDTLFVHHSLTLDGNPYAYANYHIDDNDWPGIAYTYVIQKDGTIYQTNYWETLSYHASGHNTRSLSICLTGNFDVQVPTMAQMDSLRMLTLAIFDELGELDIRGHNEVSSKTCPGTNFSVQDFKNSLYA